MSVRTCLLALVVIAGAACSGGAGAGAGADASVPTYNGCTQDTFVAGSSSTTVDFGGVSGSPLFGYAPRCVRIAPGDSLAFKGDFSVHPLSPGTSPTTTTAGSANSPIVATGTGNLLSVRFPSAGVYPYFCQMHYAAGMAGVVLVQ